MIYRSILIIMDFRTPNDTKPPAKQPIRMCVDQASS